MSHGPYGLHPFKNATRSFSFGSVIRGGVGSFESGSRRSAWSRTHPWSDVIAPIPPTGEPVPEAPVAVEAARPDPVRSRPRFTGWPSSPRGFDQLW